MKEVRKVKSIQIFRKPAQEAIQGDRAGICVTQFDANLLERGLVSSPGLLPTAFGIIIDMAKIKYYKSDITSGSKFHVSIGHSTILSTITLFYMEKSSPEEKCDFSFENEHAYLPSLSDLSNDQNDEEISMKVQIFALLEFDHSAVIALNSKILGSKLDTDVHTTSCRLAFEGQLLHPILSEKYKTEDLPKLKVFKLKEKSGLVERANNDYELIGKNMFKKETNIHLFDGFKVTLSNGLFGVIDGPFGQSGKFKIRLNEALNEDLKSALSGKNKKKKGPDDVGNKAESVELKMSFKKYIFSKKMAQK